MYDRRDFLVRTGVALSAAGYADLLRADDAAATPDAALLAWSQVRRQFSLSRSYLHFGGLLLASHPAPVRRAIGAHRARLDANPVHYLHARGPEFEAAVLREAAAYLRVDAADVALTDSTTMGLGLLYNGLALRRGQEIITTRHDFFATHEAVERAASRAGASVRTVSLYERAARASADEIVRAITRAVTPKTRVVALT